MDSLTDVLWAWRNGAILILAILMGAVLIYRFGKTWWNSDASYTAILVTGLIGTVLPLCLGWDFGVRPRTLFYILLYIWCVLGMLFLAGRQTSFIKLLLGIASQAGIVYALFRLI